MFPLLPPLPSWNAAHPIIVHLPLGVLGIVPVLVLIAMLAWKSRRTAGGIALLVLFVGTLGTVMAVASGEAAEEAVIIPGLAERVFSEHEDLAEMARNIFLGITAFYVLVNVLNLALKDKFKRPLWIGAHVLTLIALGGGLLVLINAGHLGGRLVHEFGVRAPMGSSALDAPMPKHED